MLKETKAYNYTGTYGKNWKEEDKRWCLTVDGSWKKSMQEEKEEWKAVYGWSLVEKGQEVGSGGEAIQAMSSLQAEANAILKSLKSNMNKNMNKLEIWRDCRNIVTGLRATLKAPPQIRTILWDIVVLLGNFKSFIVINVSRDKVVRAHGLTVKARRAIS